MSVPAPTPFPHWWATANNTTTQKKRDRWTPPSIPSPPPIPSCWRSSSCERTVKRDWTPPTPSPPSIPSCWWSQTCKGDVAGGQVTQSIVGSLINQAVKAGVFTPTYGDTLDGLLPQFSTAATERTKEVNLNIIGDLIKGVTGAGTGVGRDAIESAIKSSPLVNAKRR
ncbi:hypothetical protein EV363DRAFT_1295329 [Boletus edulis]|nr:hypothetical protein EV363DRAFT_1295329 [Boletus edulis]